jgi:hypothetical protein
MKIMLKLHYWHSVSIYRSIRAFRKWCNQLTVVSTTTDCHAVCGILNQPRAAQGGFKGWGGGGGFEVGPVGAPRF